MSFLHHAGGNGYGMFYSKLKYFSFNFQVYLDSPLIVNGLCVRWKGYINMEKLDGVGGFRFDEEFARVR